MNRRRSRRRGDRRHPGRGARRRRRANAPAAHARAPHGRDHRHLRCVARVSPQGSGSLSGGLGLSQADEGVRAGDRRQAVERRAARRRRQHRVLSRRSGDDPHFLGGGEPDVLDQGPDRADRSLHDVRRATIAGGWKPIIAFSGPRSRPTRSAPAPTRATACSPISISSGCITPRTTSCGPASTPAPACTTTITSTSHRATGRRRGAGRVGGVTVRALQRGARPAARRAGVGRARASICCGTRATASSTPRTAGSRRPATARRSTGSSAPTRAGSGESRRADLPPRLARAAVTRSPGGCSPI